MYCAAIKITLNAGHFIFVQKTRGMLYFCKVCELRYFTCSKKTDKVLTIGKYLHHGAPVTLHMSIQAEV